MEDFGSDFITITDEDGVEYELEILSELDYQGAHYLAVVPAMDSEEEPEELEVSWPPAATEAKLLMQLVYASSMPISSYISTMLFMEESFR